MYDAKVYKNKQYAAGGRTVVWFFDDKEHDASRLLPDNLFIIDEHGNEIWSMREAVGREDVCVLLRVDGERFFFATFNGFSAWMDMDTLETSDIKTGK